MKGLARHLLLLAIPIFGAVAGPEIDHPVLDVSAAMRAGEEARLVLAAAVPVHETRRAGRILARFAAGQEVTVLAMDKHGLHVRGLGPNGPLKGWIGRKLAMGADPEVQDRAEAFYARQLVVADLATRKQAVLNLSTAEMERIFGPPDRRSTGAGIGGTRERLEWVRRETLDLNKALGGALAAIDKDSPLAKPEIETARMTVDCVDGVVRAIDGSLGPSAGEAPTLSPPGPCPFVVVKLPPQATALRAGP